MIVSPVFLFEPYPVALHVEERGLQKRNDIFAFVKHNMSFNNKIFLLIHGKFRLIHRKLKLIHEKFSDIL